MMRLDGTAARTQLAGRQQRRAAAEAGRRLTMHAVMPAPHTCSTVCSLFLSTYCTPWSSKDASASGCCCDMAAAASGGGGGGGSAACTSGGGGGGWAGTRAGGREAAKLQQVHPRATH